MYFKVSIFLVRKKKYNLKKSFNVWKNAIFDYYIFRPFIMKKFERILNDPFLDLCLRLCPFWFPFHWYILFARLPSHLQFFFRNLNSQLEGSHKILIQYICNICAWLEIGKEFQILLLLDPAQVQISE